MEMNQITKKKTGCAIEVHKNLAMNLCGSLCLLRETQCNKINYTENH